MATRKLSDLSAIHSIQPTTHNDIYTTISFNIDQDDVERDSAMTQDFHIPPHQGVMNRFYNVPIVSNCVHLYSSKTRLFVFTFVAIPAMFIYILLAVVTSPTSKASTNNCQPPDNILNQQKAIYSSTSELAMVVTDNDLCSEIGAQVLREGGLAIDAAIAASLCLGSFI